MAPEVSVVVTVFNSERFLREALDSVAGQHFRNFELIVVDDGSERYAACDICRDFEADTAIPVQYYYKANGGPSSARNAGLSLSAGEYLAFLDADDLFVDTKLSIQWQLLHGLPKDFGCVIGGSVKFRNGESKPYETFYPADINEAIDVEGFLTGTTRIEGTPGHLFRRSALIAIDGFDESLWNNEDFDLLLRLNRWFRIKTHKDVVFRQRMRPDSLSKAQPIDGLGAALRFTDKVALQYSKISRQAIARNRQRAYLSAALQCLRRRNLRHYIWLVNEGFDAGPCPRGWRAMLAYVSAKSLAWLGAKPAELEF